MSWNKPPKKAEEIGVDLVMEIILLSKSGKPYKEALQDLKKYAKYPKVRAMIQRVVGNMKKGR